MSLGLEPVNTVIALVGVITGSFSLFLYWWKKRTRTFRMLDIIGFYDLDDSKIKGFNDVTAFVKVGFYNGSDETISVTDIIATLKYDKDRYKALVSTGVSGLEEAYSARPSNFDDVIPLNILPYQTVKKELEIKFPTTFLDAIHRYPIVDFVGFLENSRPLYFHDEKKFIKNWLLTVHVNAREEHRRFIFLFKKGETGPSGTFLLQDIKRFEKDYIEKY
jgi:hypothetical protein